MCLAIYVWVYVQCMFCWIYGIVGFGLVEEQPLEVYRIMSAHSLPSDFSLGCCSNYIYLAIGNSTLVLLKDNIPMRHPYYKGEIQLADTVPSDRSSFHCCCILLPSQSSHRHHFPHSLLFIHFASFNLTFLGILSTFCCRLFFGKEKDACDDK